MNTDYYVLKEHEAAEAYGKMNNPAVFNLWQSFTLKKGNISLNQSNELIFRIGKTAIPILPDDKEFSIKVDKDGICIVGADYGGLMRGFFSLLMKFEYENGFVKIKHTEENSNYNLKNRMIHICVFPENNLYFIKKLIRFSAMCQYTHIVIEFWGMLKYDCLKELSWKNAFSKSEVKELVSECKALGIEPIPMFNHLGHATASRVCYGKHVVLDQNPAMQELFTPDGWAWNITSKDTCRLLKQIRTELYEIFADSRYIHIGCDEAYCISENDTLRAYLPEYLKELTNEIENEGKRPMLWMDMLLEKDKFPHCYTTATPEEATLLQNSVSPSTIFVDWQYECTETPIPSLESLKNSSHDCMGAPWFNKENHSAHINTIKENNMFGIMLTTWDALKHHFPNILECAKLLGCKGFVWSVERPLEETATLMRKISFEGNNYEDCGWSAFQIEV